MIVPKRRTSGESPLQAPAGIEEPVNQVEEVLGPGAVTVPPAPAKFYPLRQGGDDREPAIREKREKIKEVSVIQ